MEKRELTKEDIDKVRNIAGFPIGTDEDIIALSDAPYYTACPNPFIEEFIAENGTPYDEETDDYKCEPYIYDVSEDKHDLIYNIHSYHTKVPHKAIMKYLEHYTKPGDIVLDVFCGSGMTGVAAQLCESGARKPILIDLSPYATFLTRNYNTPNDDNTISDLRKIIEDLKEKFGYLYETNHVIDGKEQKDINGNPIKGKINYTIWSDVFYCPNCGEEIIYYYDALDPITQKAQKKFKCKSCNIELSKSNLEIKKESKLVNDKIIDVAVKIPVLINYSVNKRRFNKTPDEEDVKLLESMENLVSSYWYPTDRMCNGKESRRNDKFGFKYSNQFFTERTIFFSSSFLNKIIKSNKIKKDNNKSKFLFTAVLPKLTVFNRFMPEHKSRALVGPMTGTYYMPSLSVENNVLNQIETQLTKLSHLTYKSSDIIVSTQSSTDLSNIQDNSIDYIFIDPPFGANIMYSELNFMAESWLKIKTNSKDEAIINTTQMKGLTEYTNLITSTFKELYRVLKPNRWLTIEFHNSHNSVWNSIQESLQSAGFIISDVRTLNKEKKTIHQFVADNVVDQDLIISSYKPKEITVRNIELNAGSPETAFEFVQQHLENLPIAVNSGDNGLLNIITERQAFLLFDRMVAYHMTRGMGVPIDAPLFYEGLKERFIERDGMYFLSSQVTEYDLARERAKGIEQVQTAFVITNEKSAIGWLYAELGKSPKKYSELQPNYLKARVSWSKREKEPELSEMLEENFLKDDDGAWYVPDIKKSADIAKLREKNLLKEFQQYQAAKGKIKVFRSEAVRAGFAKLWNDRNYAAIVEMAHKLPSETIQEDPHLLMFYDQSLERV